jgi:exopolysaccharide biosynthesis polyprenyl glycosylphosphotransferase
VSTAANERRVVSAPYEAPTYRWQDRYARVLLALDVIAVLAAGFIAMALRFDGVEGRFRGTSYTEITFAVVPIWVALLWATRSYEERYLGTGSDEYRRVFDASVRFIALVSLIAFLGHYEFSRRYVGVLLLVGTLLLLAGRYIARKYLHWLRRHGRCAHRVVLAGDRKQVSALYETFMGRREAGFLVVGACTPEGREDVIAVHSLEPLPVLGSMREIVDAVRVVGGDTVALASGNAFGSDVVKHLAWELEGSGVALLVAPGLVDVAGPRIHIRPVAGLPLLHVEEPEFTGARRLLKAGFDHLVAATLVVLLSPLILLLALIVGCTSRGGVLFKQDRVGLGGRVFCTWKFRTMRADAEHLLRELQHHNEHNGVLFKMRRDPRVTRIGRFLRRTSLDELPQLFNVLRGEMSLVGPRPPLPNEVERYHPDVHRRLLVKPGMTGLWQVSGRSELSWEDTVRLDLYYVENWSLALDFQILWRTVAAVTQGRGAY